MCLHVLPTVVRVGRRTPLSHAPLKVLTRSLPQPTHSFGSSSRRSEIDVSSPRDRHRHDLSRRKTLPHGVGTSGRTVLRYGKVCACCAPHSEVAGISIVLEFKGMSARTEAIPHANTKAKLQVESYHKLAKLGEGTYATVYKGVSAYVQRVVHGYAH